MRSAASGVPFTVPPGLSMTMMMARTLASASAASASSANSPRSQHPYQPSTSRAMTPRADRTATLYGSKVSSSSKSSTSQGLRSSSCSMRSLGRNAAITSRAESGEERRIWCVFMAGFLRCPRALAGLRVFQVLGLRPGQVALALAVGTWFLPCWR